MNNDRLFEAITQKIIKRAHAPDLAEYRESWIDPGDRLIHRLMFGHEPKDDRKPFDRIPVADHILQASGATIKLSDGRANGGSCYDTEKDQILLPDPLLFRSAEDLYCTAFHELAHWTGARHRLNRPTITHPFTTKRRYCFEEIVAETASAFVLGAIGLDHTEHNAGYIEGFFNKGLGGDIDVLNKAVGKAVEAANYILEKAK